MTTKAPIKNVFGQDSLLIQTAEISVAVTLLGGHLAPVTFFRNTKAPVQPYRVFPWWNERIKMNNSPVLVPLRGDFFCMPFGSNDAPYHGERHPSHGETASRKWAFRNLCRRGMRTTLEMEMRLMVRPGLARKSISLRDGHNAIYCRHEAAGMSGRMCFGHHANIAFPDAEGSGLVSVAPFVHGQVYPRVFSDPREKAYQILKPGSLFTSFSSVERIDGGMADLSCYPARRGYDDLVMVCAESSVYPGWSAVVFHGQKYVWFGLKDPKVLASTVLWHDNGGRHDPPWSGRSINTLGIEEVTSYFHEGLAPSAAKNPIKTMGIATDVQLSKTKPFVVNYIMGVARVPAGFGHVREIAAAGNDLIIIRDENRKEVRASIHLPFLKDGKVGDEPSD